MKIIKICFWVLFFLPLAMTALAYPLLPDSIPMHINWEGVIDRYGNKMEAWLIPLSAFPGALIPYGAAMWDPKGMKEKTASNEKMCLLLGCMTALVFVIIDGVFLFMGLYHDAEHLVFPDILTLVSLTFGVGNMIVGNLLPKCRRNGVIGCRTVFSVKDDETWRLSQRGAGWISMACGGLILLGYVCGLQGKGYLFYAIGICAADFVITYLYTYYVWKKVKKKRHNTII